MHLRRAQSDAGPDLESNMDSESMSADDSERKVRGATSAAANLKNVAFGTLSLLLLFGAARVRPSWRHNEKVCEYKEIN